jgi:hypothetical protein
VTLVEKMTKVEIPTTSRSDNVAAQALDAAMQMAGGVSGQGTTQAGATTYKPKSKTVEVSVVHSTIDVLLQQKRFPLHVSNLSAALRPVE